MCNYFFEMLSQLLYWMKTLNNMISHFNFVMYIQECEITSFLVLPLFFLFFFVNTKSGALYKYKLWVEVRRREWRCVFRVRRRPNLTPSKISSAARWHALFPSASTLHAMPISANERLLGVMVKDHFSFFPVRGLSVMAFFLCYIYIYISIYFTYEEDNNRFLFFLVVCLFVASK